MISYESNKNDQNSGQPKFNYKFFCAQENPENLVMLRNPAQITETIFQNTDLIYIWICQNQLESIKVKTRVLEQLKIKIQIFKSVNQSFSFIESKRINKLLLISSRTLDVQILLRKTQINYLIIYNKSLLSIDLQSLQKLQILRSQVSCEVELFQQIKNLVQKQFKFKQLPTFISSRDQTWNSRIVVQTMFAMLNQKITNQGRQLIVDQLGSLFRQIMKQSEDFKQFQESINCFLSEIKQDQLNTKRIIYWHTLQSPVYKLINNLLRVSRHPSETFYIQPYFKDLFTAISTLHKKQIKQQQFLIFTCYRGGLASRQELAYLESNIGQIVQNLGFLSTSSNEQQALNYTKNIFFQIQVHCSQGIQDFGYGYAQISRFSHYFAEQQILFNPLNYFKVVQISNVNLKGQQIKKVKLLVGDQINRLFTKEDRHLTKQQQRLKAKLISQRNAGVKKTNQGLALVENYQYLTGAMEYWQNYTGMMKQNNVQRVRALREMDCCYRWIGNYDKALQILSRSQQVLESINQLKQEQRISLKNSINYQYFAISISNGNFNKALELYAQYEKQNRQNFNLQYKFQYLLNMAVAHLELFNRTTSLQILEETKKMLLQCAYINDIKYAQCLKQMGKVYFNMKNYQKALQLYRQSKDITLNIEGEQSVQYVIIITKQALTLCGLQKFKESLSMCDKAFKILLQIESSMPAGCNVYKTISKVYLRVLQPRKALQMMYRELRMIENQQGQDNEQYIMTLFFITQIYRELNEKSKSFEIFKKIEKWMQLRSNFKLFPSILTLMAKICIHSQQYEKALKYLQRNCTELKAQNKQSLDEYAHTILIKSSLMKKRGIFTQSLHCYEIGSKIYQNLNITLSQQYLIDQIDINQQIGEFNNALKIIDQVEALSKYNSAKAYCVCRKLKIYRNLGYHPQAQQIIQKSHQEFFKSEKGGLNYFYMCLLIEKSLTFYQFEQFRKTFMLIERWKFLYSIQKQTEMREKQKGELNELCINANNCQLKLKKVKQRDKTLTQISYLHF